VTPITDAVIPVAGLGTRLLPATRSQPKEMLPVVDKPVVQYVVEELAAAGITRVLMVTGRRKRAIEDHFDPVDTAVPAPGPKLFYTRQPTPAGLGDALARADGFAAARPVVVALGDSIIEPGTGAGIVARLTVAYERSGASAAVAVQAVPDALVSRYGIVVPADGGALTDFGAFAVADVLEKPEASAVTSRYAVMARYVLGPSVLAALTETPPDAGGEVQVADALRAVIVRGERVVAVPLGPGERRHDIGTVESYCATFLRYALRDPRFGGEMRAQVAALLVDA
jgi:UTP--glucose-1-phosphate uridylyltransferase